MNSRTEAGGPLFELRSGTVFLLFLVAASLIVLTSAHLSDFHFFYAAGEKYWSGTTGEVYYGRLFSARAFGVGEATQPWGYPPQFTFVVAGLALLPTKLSFILFMSVTLVAYLLILGWIAGGQFAVVLIGVFPIIAANILTSQNGFLVASLGGLFVLLCLRGSRRAGMSLGLMVIKPHLAVGLGLYILLSRRWGWVAQTALVVAGTSVLSMLALGTDIWAHFLNGLEEVSSHLEAGSYPLHRMTSVYAGLRSFGVDPQVAFGAQVCAALCGVAAVVLTVAQGWRRDRALATAIMASLIMSPYNYDYDLCLFGVAFALVINDVSALTSRRLIAAVFGLVWLSSGYGFAALFAYELSGLGQAYGLPELTLSLGGSAFVFLVGLLFAILWRAERREAAPSRKPLQGLDAGPALPVFGRDVA